MHAGKYDLLLMPQIYSLPDQYSISVQCYPYKYMYVKRFETVLLKRLIHWTLYIDLLAHVGAG